MSRSDAMVVGLKLLAAYLIITGLMAAASAVPLWLYADQERIGGDILKTETYRDVVRGGISVFGGVVLLILSARWSVRDLVTEK